MTILLFTGIRARLNGAEQFLKANLLTNYLIDEERNPEWQLRLEFVDKFQFTLPEHHAKPFFDTKIKSMDIRAYYEYGKLVAVNQMDKRHKKMVIVMKAMAEKKSLDYILPYLAFEKFLWVNQRFILHSSVIKYRDRAIAFIGPSGVGKSTQANLWQNYEHVEMIAGDRSALEISNDSVNVYGIPFDGSACCYSNIKCPLIGIVALKQGEIEKLERLNVRESFKEVYSQITINTWNEQFQKEAIDFCIRLISIVPVYRLTCRISKNAVDIVRGELYDK